MWRSNQYTNMHSNLLLNTKAQFKSSQPNQSPQLSFHQNFNVRKHYKYLKENHPNTKQSNYLQQNQLKKTYIKENDKINSNTPNNTFFSNGNLLDNKRQQLKLKEKLNGIDFIKMEKKIQTLGKFI